MSGGLTWRLEIELDYPIKYSIRIPSIYRTVRNVSQILIRARIRPCHIRTPRGSINKYVNHNTCNRRRTIIIYVRSKRKPAFYYFRSDNVEKQSFSPFVLKFVNYDYITFFFVDVFRQEMVVTSRELLLLPSRSTPFVHAVQDAYIESYVSATPFVLHEYNS